MAVFNKVILIGRLTRDVETRAFANGGLVAKFGFAVTNRRKNAQTGQWEDEPMFIDCEVFNRGEFGKLADLVRDRCRKGSQVFIEGRLHLEQWVDKNGGGNRAKHKIIVETVQLFDPKDAGQGGESGPVGRSDGFSGGGGGFGSSAPASHAPVDGGNMDDDNGGNGDIPF